MIVTLVLVLWLPAALANQDDQSTTESSEVQGDGESGVKDASDSNDNSSVALEEVVVTGRAQDYYRVSESTVGTKTPTEFLDIASSIQVLSQQLIEDQAAVQITDLYRSISGFSQYSYSGVTARGFRQDVIRYDGVAGDPFSQFGIPELFNIERVEVLKGPSGMLYGSAQPGGMINYVTKKPTAETQGNFTMRVGNYGLYSIGGEYSGPLNESGSVRIRLGGYYSRKEPFRYNFENENTILDAGLEWVISENTSLLFQATYVEQSLWAQRERGVPVDNDGNFITDIRWTASEPTDLQYLEAFVYQGRLMHHFDIGNGLDTTFTVRSINNDRIQNYHEPRGVLDLDGDGEFDTMRRQFRDQSRSNDELSITFDNVYIANLANMQHTFLVGADYYDQDASGLEQTSVSDLIGGQVPSLSLYDPVYGLTSGTNYTDFQVVTPIDGSAKRTGFYIQDQIELSEHWQVVAGYRFDTYDNVNRESGGSFSDNQGALKGGLIYKVNSDVSLYGSYSEGFVPQPLESQDVAIGGPFDPEESVQYEIGAKTELFGGRAQASIAVYQIVKENVLQPDPDPDAPAGALIQFGEVTSKGVEIDFVGDIMENWVLMANYAYNDTRITETTGDYVENAVGDKFSNAPENQAGLWTRYDFPGINSAIAGGLDYVDERLSFSGQKVKAYTTFDMSWHTNWNNLEFQMNIKNLLDKVYAQSGFTSRAGHFPGEPRTISFQVSADF